MKKGTIYLTSVEQFYLTADRFAIRRFCEDEFAYDPRNTADGKVHLRKLCRRKDTNSGGSRLPSKRIRFGRRQTEPTEILCMTKSSAVTFPKLSI